MSEKNSNPRRHQSPLPNYTSADALASWPHGERRVAPCALVSGAADLASAQVTVGCVQHVRSSHAHQRQRDTVGNVKPGPKHLQYVSSKRPADGPPGSSLYGTQTEVNIFHCLTPAKLPNPLLNHVPEMRIPGSRPRYSFVTWLAITLINTTRVRLIDNNSFRSGQSCQTLSTLPRVQRYGAIT